MGSLTGAVASERVSEALKGSLRMVGNHSKSAKAEGSLTARATTRADRKLGLSDPAVASGSAVAQRIKATLGITGLSPPRVHIDGEVWHLDVVSPLLKLKKATVAITATATIAIRLFSNFFIPLFNLNES